MATTEGDLDAWRAGILARVSLLVGLGLAGVGCETGSAEPSSAPVEVLGAVEFAPDALITEHLGRSEPSTPPPAPVAVSPTGQQRVDAIVATIGFDVAHVLTGWTIVAEGPREGLQALTFTDENRIAVYIRDSHDDDDLRRIVAHELGHALDLTLLDDESRTAWKAERSISTETPWWPEAARNDFQTGAGDFAEAVSSYLSGRPTLSKVASELDDGDRFFISRLFD